MAEFNEIKFKGQIQGYSTLKAGLKRSDLNGDAVLQSIFDKIDTANENGVKDGILDANEVKIFMQKIVEFAKGGRDRKLSSKEANKFLQSLGVENADSSNLFGLLNSLSVQSKNIKQTTVNTQKGSNIIEYTDGHTEEIFADGSQIITVKSGDTTIVTKQDKNGNIIAKTETTVKDGVQTVLEYEGETPKSKTVTDINNKTVSNYTFENGEETLVQEENTQTGDVTTYKNNTKTITKKDGTVVVENDGQTTTTSPDGNTITVNSENSTVTTVRNPEDKSETITTYENGVTTILNKKDGKNISQTVTKDGQTSSLEYDGNGNTKGVVVQNGESPAVVAKKFGCKVEDLIAANPDAIKGKAPNQYFLVGADIVIPGEMNAEKFAQLNAGRQTKEQAIGKYTQFVQAQQAQIEAEDKELAARKGHGRSFIEQKWNTFEECAIAYYKREGVTNPTKRQIELRVKELQDLNPNLKDGEIKGKQIIATFSPETDAQIGAGQQKREAEGMEREQKNEATEGKSIAQTMFNAIDGLSWNGGVSKKEFKTALNSVNSDNVVGLLKQYNEISPDETLIEAIFDETGSSLEDRKNAVQKIVDSLIQRAQKVNVSDERQKQAIEACKKELDSYWSLGIGYCQTSKLDGLVNNLIGTIDAAEALTNEEKNRMSGNGINETLDLMNTQVTENTSALNAQLAEDGWCADLYEGLKWCVGSDNLDEHVKADLKEYEGYIAELQKAEQTGGEAGFKAKFKEIFGVDYDPNLMKGYNKLQSNFAMAQGLTMQKEGFYSEFESCINGQEDYFSMRDKYGQYLVQLAQAEGQNIDANNAVDSVIATQLQKSGLDIQTATDVQKRQALKTVISDTYNAFDAELNKYTQGRSLSNMEKQLKNAGSAVFGNKNDIAFRVNDYISSQQQGGAAVNMAVKAAGAIAIGVATGGVGFAALATAAGATAVLSATVDLTDRVSSEVGLKEDEVANILKNATIDGASVFAGGIAGKYAAMFKNANSFVQAGGKLAITTAADAATGAAGEYLQTGTITLEGVAFQAVFSASGNLVSLKQLTKTDIPSTTSGDPQSVRVSKGVKGDVNNHRDAIADGEVARNADQTHLSANERKMVEQGLEDVPTPEELAAYQKQHGYEPVPDADKPAYQAHQEQVGADYANAHKLENNAVIVEQKVPSAPKEVIDKLNDEIKGIDGSIKRLEQQIAGAKRFGKNTETLEKQLDGLKAKRAAKAAELEATQKPQAQSEPEVKADTPAGETPKADVKADATPESVKQSANNISDAEIPVEHKGLWQNCKKQIDKITDELKNFKGDVDAMLLKCENLFADLRTIAKNANESVKNKINKLIEDLRSMLTPKNLPNVDGALTPSITPQHRMAMGQIGNSIPRAKSLDDLNKLQAWLDNMPECSQKTNLQNQLNAKYAQVSSPHAGVSPKADYSNSPIGTRLPKNEPVTLTGMETLKLADYDLDLSSCEIQTKLKAMKDGDVITVGRNVQGSNDIKIDGNFTTVSGKHLQIEKVGDKFVVTDLSTNGTTIGKSVAHVSDEIKTTFGHQTINSLADLKPGEVQSITKDNIRYTIENNNGKIRIASSTRLNPSLNKAIKFDEIRMSNRTPNGKANPGKTMGELLTPQQKQVYSDSLDAFERSKNKKIVHNANNVLTTDNMLHGTDLDALLNNGGILDNGLVPREISGNSAAQFEDGSVPDTLTPLCSDVWDIRRNATIKDYFDANNSHWNNYGESYFLPNSNQMASPVVIVFDKKSIDPTIIDNSFGVNNSGKSILFENGNMSRGHNYPTHRAIPIGAPANSIDRIIVDTRRVGQSEINALQQKIKSQGLDIKLYDLNGNLLSK
ncbi:hypothetical protein DBY21_09235 [Candidatus Gastranaerophilales bacterium]|nr:MAG: hypothetical protein DBY21_09235 [Candidatus Gastranaerophilales bacterium]